MLNVLFFKLRATLRRGFAFSTSINNKNPPLTKSRNVTSLSLAHQQSLAPTAGSVNAHSSHVQAVYESVRSINDIGRKAEASSSDA